MKINSIILITILLNFTGCLNLTQKVPAYATYTINVNNQFTKNKNNLNMRLEIKEPKALASINSKYISYATKSYTSEHYALSKWSDNPSKMIQTQVVKYLLSTNNYALVNSSHINVQNNYQLLSEIDTFHQSFKGKKSFVKFVIQVYLKNRKITYHKTFTYTQPCKENNALGAVKALNGTVNSFVQDLDIWILNIAKQNQTQ